MCGLSKLFGGDLGECLLVGDGYPRFAFWSICDLAEGFILCHDVTLFDAQFSWGEPNHLQGQVPWPLSRPLTSALLGFKHWERMGTGLLGPVFSFALQLAVERARKLAVSSHIVLKDLPHGCFFACLCASKLCRFYLKGPQFFLAMAGKRKVGSFTAAEDRVLARTLWQNELQAMNKGPLVDIWWKWVAEIMNYIIIYYLNPFKYQRVGRCQMKGFHHYLQVRIGCCGWQSVRPPTAGSPSTSAIRCSHLAASKHIGCREVCSPLLTFPGLRQDFVVYLDWVCVNQES